MKHHIDWSKNHCGVMLCSYEQTVEMMPDVKPILDELTEQLEMPWSEYVVDVKVHMLMPEQFPCIPNWHYDFRPRDEEGKHVKDAEISPLKMFLWLSGTPLTLFKSREDGSEYEHPAQEWHSMTQADMHRGQASEEHTLRGFIRVIPKKFIHPTTINVGTKRIHTQIYLDSRKFRW